MSQEPTVKTQPKLKSEPLVNGCPLCNTGYEEPVNTNEEITCPACEKTFIVRTK